MRILGIDPGIATIGFSLLINLKNSYHLERCGVITTPAHTRLSSRLDSIFRDVTELIQTLGPDCVSIEELFFNTNKKTAVDVAQARGVILLAATMNEEQQGIPVFEYTPLQVKQAVTGYGRAEKKQVMEMVRRLCSLNEVPKPDDAADAVALAICHARSSGSLLSQLEGDKTCFTI